MPKTRLLKNLDRLRAGLDSERYPENPALRPLAQAAAWSMPLTHSVSTGTFEAICDPNDPDGALISQELLTVKLNKDKRGTSEIVMGTTNDVFLYLSAFTYPETSCGFLFRETFQPVKNATATPFDTGAFGKNFEPPTGTTGADRRRFKKENEMPIPECRAYLADQLERFISLDEYLHLPGFLWWRPHPQGVAYQSAIAKRTTIDDRAHTHEVQVEERVPWRGSPHLEAIFVQAGTPTDELIPQVPPGTVRRCQEPQESGFSGEFKALREACVKYILQERKRGNSAGPV